MLRNRYEPNRAENQSAIKNVDKTVFVSKKKFKKLFKGGYADRLAAEYPSAKIVDFVNKETGEHYLVVKPCLKIENWYEGKPGILKTIVIPL